ncbi:Ankyrin_repeat-containing protein [Hexamita inflata]|uniref:Ankyrin repeat-containing protein n=1 Tax=Hexamita inflata TaxID=28002 RepID=A0AA86RVS2_9EUKA|nr:Ankyrin repeat-containing protein [Hexamita inflata]
MGCVVPSFSPNSSWFDAAQSQNIQYLFQNTAACAGLTDTRTKPGSYFGWTALHYAILADNEEIFKLLLPLERNLSTKERAVVQFQDQLIRIPSGSSPVHLILYFNRVNLLSICIDFMCEDIRIQHDLCQCRDSAGYSPLLYCPVLDNEACAIWARNKDALKTELRISDIRGENFLFKVVQQNKTEYISLVIDILTEQKLINIEITNNKLKETMRDLLKPNKLTNKNWRDETTFEIIQMIENAAKV